MAILQRDEPGFEEAEHQDAADEDERRPQYEMNPDRWLELHFNDSAECHDDGAQGKDDEHRRSVAGIMGAEIEAAASAGPRYRQETVVDRALAAAWATAEQCHGEYRRRRGER